MNKPKTIKLAAAEIELPSFLWRLLWSLSPSLPEMSSLEKTLCQDSTTAGMTLEKKRSFFAFAGLQTHISFLYKPGWLTGSWSTKTDSSGRALHTSFLPAPYKRQWDNKGEPAISINYLFNLTFLYLLVGDHMVQVYRQE